MYQTSGVMIWPGSLNQYREPRERVITSCWIARLYEGLYEGGEERRRREFPQYTEPRYYFNSSVLVQLTLLGKYEVACRSYQAARSEQKQAK